MPKVSFNEKYNKKYTEESLRQALEEIEHGASKKAISRKYNIPRSTLQFRLSNKPSKLTHGPPPVLSEKEEGILVDWIKDSVRKGFPQRKEDVQSSVQKFLEENPRPNPFKNNYPGDGWYKSFLRRHPTLVERQPEGVTSASANVSGKDIEMWFKQIENYLQEHEYFDILQDPTRVYNSDETNFQLCPKTKNVIAPRGTRNVYEVDRGQAKSTLTVLFTFSASGETTPPMVIFPYKRLPQNICDSVPKHWGIGATPNGWMKVELFYEYISKVFYKHLEATNVTFPVILFVDGHSTHLNYKVSELCKKLGIILICLYPNSTRVLQPADVSAFKPLKCLWKKAVLNWRRENSAAALTKDKFGYILESALTHLKPQVVRNGFRACGLYPWDKNAVDYSKCLGKKKCLTDSQIQSTIAVEPSAFEKVLNYEDFKRIVGEERISIFKQLSEPITNTDDSDFTVLYRLYEEFQDNTNEKENAHGLGADIEIYENANTEEVVMESSNIFNIVDIPIVFATRGSATDLNKEIIIEEVVVSKNNNEALCSHQVLEIEEKEEESLKESPTQEEKTKKPFEEVISHDKKGFNIGDVKNDRKIGWTLNNSETAINGQALEDYLNYPETPQRQNKRQTERMSFVLTAEEWQNAQKAKRLKKQDLERQKEDRKQKRLEILAAKSGQPKKVLKTTKKPKIETKTKVKDDNVPIITSNSSCVVDLKTPENKIKVLSDITVKSRDHARKLSFDFEPIRVKKYVLPEDFRDNERSTNGICFICTFNLTNSNAGIKCLTCLRVFHPKCIRKHNPMPPIVHSYICNACNRAAKNQN